MAAARSIRRRGLASALAMLFLVLFAVLAVGFAAEMQLSAQIAANDRNRAIAHGAADSGMGFIRYQLRAIVLPSSTNNSNLLTNVAAQLGNELNGTGNMGGSTVGITSNAIYIPSATTWMTADASVGSRFQIRITQDAANPGTLDVTSHGVGPSQSMTQGIEVQFQATPGNSSILNYGIAAQGPISMSGNATIVGASTAAQGSVMSATAQATPLSMSGNVSISGDFSDTNPAGNLSLSGIIRIGGYSPTQSQFAQHVHRGITPPVFPTVDTSMYLPYATSIYTGGSGNQTVVNAIIPANTNPNFSGNTTIQGVVFIRTPNRVTFSGNVTIQGAIVVEDNPKGASNSITFSGNVTASAMSTLPANATFPAGERALNGAFLLAPSFAATFSGNFGTIGGSLVADSFTFSGNAGGTVNGSVIALKDVPFSVSGNSPFQIGTPVSGIPTGLTFPGGYGPIPGSYAEIQ